MPAKTKIGRRKSALKAWATRRVNDEILVKKRRRTALKAWRTRRKNAAAA